VVILVEVFRELVDVLPWVGGPRFAVFKVGAQGVRSDFWGVVLCAASLDGDMEVREDGSEGRV
jgi:hypothetical protein